MDTIALVEQERDALLARYPMLATVTVRRHRGRGRRFLARYHGGLRIVEVADSLAEEPEHVVRDTARHELAHAIAGVGAGHGPAWRAVCLAIGAHPERCAILSTKAWQPARIGYRCSGCSRGIAVGPRSRAARALAAVAPLYSTAGVTSRCCRAPLARDPSQDRAAGLVDRVPGAGS